jgi:hypothetical protein
MRGGISAVDVTVHCREARGITGVGDVTTDCREVRGITCVGDVNNWLQRSERNYWRWRCDT